MEKQRDNLDEFINALKNEPVPGKPPQEVVDKILQELGEAEPGAAEEKIKITERIKALKSFTKIAAAAVIIIAVLIGVRIFIGLREESAAVVRRVDVSETEGAVETIKEIEPALDVNLRAELKKLEQMFAAGDIDGLVAVLSEGHFVSRFFAANYLARIGDLRAVAALEKLSAEYGGDETNNIFARAIEKIKSRAEAEAKEAEIEKVLNFQVLHKQTGRPMAGVELNVEIGREKREYVTDEQGRCGIEIGEKEPDYVRINAKKEGFVPMSVAYYSYYGGYEIPIDIPENYILALEPGTSIGGIVQNEQGEPIEEAEVYLYVPAGPPVGGKIEGIWIHNHIVKTDNEGRWRCDIMPAELDDVQIRLAHPDYVDNEAYGMTARPSIEELRDMTGIMRLEKGLAVSGKVLNTDGQPVEQASVAQGSDRYGSHYPKTGTDVNGRFSFSQSRPGEMVLTVQAKGYAPDLKKITVYEGMSPVEFRLGPGQTIRGQVVDSNDKPIEAVGVTADTWRGHRTIKWSSKTDSEGYFEWNDAPKDEVLFDMYKKGYMSVRKFSMSASDDEYIVTMYPPLRVSGEVVDADSNEPIRSFKLIPGIKWEKDDRISWEQSRAIKLADGRYEFKFPHPHDGHIIRIEADGYMPGISRVFTDDEGDVAFDFKLKKGTGPGGTAYLPGGAPAAGAEVILCTPSQGAYIENGRNTGKGNSRFVETGSDGKFSFPAQTEAYLLAVIHDDGYAEVTAEELAAEPNITIEPWGRVEGVLRIGSQVGAGEKVSLGYRRPYKTGTPRIYYDCSTVTDANGDFAFDKLPPGKAQVGRKILSRQFTGYSYAEPVEVKPGQIVSVTIGGTGRPVVGRVVVPADYEKPVDWAYGYNSLILKVPGKETIRRLEGREYARSYAFEISYDGTFRVEDVPAGAYDLRINLYEPPSGGLTGLWETIGSLNYEFEVPDMNDGRSDEPLDIGTLELEIRKRLEVGELAPLFEAETLDGKALRLADYRGKVVLLDFWMSTHPECVKEIPNLKEIYNSFGKNKRFCMISLSLDVDAETVSKFVKDNELEWIHGFLGEWPEAPEAKEYGIERLPARFLLGPDGTIIAKNPSFEQLESVLEEALGM